MFALPFIRARYKNTNTLSFPQTLGFSILLDARFGNFTTDISGNSVSVSLPNAGDGWSANGWTTGIPAVVLTSQYHVRLFNIGTIPQPFSVIMVMDGYTGGSNGAVNLYRDSNNGAVGYRIVQNPPTIWSMFAGTVANSSIFTTSNSAGKVMRVDTFNGAASSISRGTTVETLNPGSSLGISGIMGCCGDAAQGFSNPQCNMAVFGIIPRAITVAERSSLVSYYQGIYTGLGSA